MDKVRLALTFGDAGENHVGMQQVGQIGKIGSGFSCEELKKLKRQLQYVERDINKLEEKIAAINIKLADPVTYASDDFVPLQKDHALLKSDLDKKMEEWELVAEKIG